MNLKYTLSVLALFVGLAAGTPYDRILQMKSGDSQLVSSGPNYAISSPLLASVNWKTLSINGNNVLAIAPDCTRLETTFDGLTDQQRELVGPLTTPFEGGDVTPNDPNFVAEFNSADTTMLTRPDLQTSTYGFGKPNRGYLLRKITDENFSIARGGLAERGLTRIIFVGDDVTFVYTDGRVKTEPRNCVRGEDSFLLREINLDRREYKFTREQERFQELLAETKKSYPEII